MFKTFQFILFLLLEIINQKLKEKIIFLDMRILKQFLFKINTKL